ncbi:MAG TPA: prepilin-type N-terminal cleavage/methylation domain-containing protein [Gemmatimonadaceae bacterium]|nr:prepilin-type N-terminal cleavage/methylation domain-containing protein [Gemmatimonadaceae bacterium]
MFRNVRRGGFTLPEILVTVTIIAVLAAAVVPAVTQYVNKGNTPSSQQDVHQLQTAVTGFTADVHRYPGDLQQLITQIVTTTGSGDTLDKDGAATPVVFTTVDASRWRGPYTAAPITTGAIGGGKFTSNGLNFTIGRTITLTSNWLAVPITVPGSTATDCPAILALDKALDGAPTTVGTEGTTGVVVWTNGAIACAAATATTASAITNFKLRLVPAN